MKWLKVQYTRYRYWIWALGAVLLAVLLWFLKGSIVGRPGARKVSLPEVPKALKEKVAKAEEQALVARVEARVEAERDVKELKKAVKIKDDMKRRAKLAKMLEGL